MIWRAAHLKKCDFAVVVKAYSLAGGEDFDQRVMEHFIKLFKKKHDKDLRKDNRAVQKLRREVEKAKRALSSQHQTRIEIESLYDGIDFSETLTRAKFEELNMVRTRQWTLRWQELREFGTVSYEYSFTKRFLHIQYANSTSASSFFYCSPPLFMVYNHTTFTRIMSLAASIYWLMMMVLAQPYWGSVFETAGGAEQLQAFLTKLLGNPNGERNAAY